MRINLPNQTPDHVITGSITQILMVFKIIEMGYKILFARNFEVKFFDVLHENDYRQRFVNDLELVPTIEIFTSLEFLNYKHMKYQNLNIWPSRNFYK